MKKSTLKLLVIVLGGLLLIGFLAADFIWVDSYPGYHTQQIIAIVVGAIILVAGLALPKE